MTNKSIEEILISDFNTLTSDEKHMRIDYRVDIGLGRTPSKERTEAKFAKWEKEFTPDDYISMLEDEMEELYKKVDKLESKIEELSKDK